VLAIAACAVERPAAPDVAIVTWPGQPHLPIYDAAVAVWSPLGFARVDSSELPECPRDWYVTGDVGCVITIGIKREAINSQANRSERYVLIDSRTTNDLDLLVAVAHEVGHVVLDTPEHTHGGVMGGSSSQLTDADLELACRAIGLGC
jgi:hypothetical protein